jgi:hypothetical protein
VDRFRLWPPRPGLLITLTPEYIRGIDFNNQENWGIEEWRTYARFLEEKGQQFIDELKHERNQLSIALDLQKAKASRRKKKRYSPAVEKIAAILAQHELAKQGGLLTSLNQPMIDAPFPIIPRKKRGRKKDENSPVRRFAELIIQKQDKLKAQGRSVPCRKIIDDFSERLSWRDKEKLSKAKKTILNNVSLLKKSR